MAVIDGTSGNDNLVGNAFEADTMNGFDGNDTLYGGNGNISDFLDGGAGVDSMNGGDGSDTYIVDNVGDICTEAFNDAFGGTADTVRASVSYTISGFGIENLTLTGTAIAGTGNGNNNIIVGNNQNNTLSGLDGNDTLDGGFGFDTFDGGNGSDTVDYQFWDNGLTVNLATGIASFEFNVPTETLTNIENILAGDANDSLTGSNAANLLNGGVGNDTLDGGNGNDTLIGGAGDDALYATSGVENLSGGDGNDGFILNSATDVTGWIVDGGDGNDVVDLIEGTLQLGTSLPFVNVESLDVWQTTFLGTAGADSYDFRPFATIGFGVGQPIVLSAGDGNDLVYTSNSVPDSDGAHAIDGQGGNDTLNGGTARDALTGGDGDDVLTGGGGNDSLAGSDGNDNLSAGDGNDTLAGGAGNDTLAAGAGANSVDGGAGNDRVYFLLGADNGPIDSDVVAGGDDIDTLDMTLSASPVEVNLTDNTVRDLGSQIGGTISGFENVVTGDGNDSLRGGAEANALDAGLGNDTLDGAGGNDVLLAGDGDDHVYDGDGADTLTGGAGVDTLHLVDGVAPADAAYDLGAASFTTAAGDVISGFENLVGSAVAETVLGSGVANALDGQAGDDTLVGGGGNDTLTGGAGADVLVGGAGDDLLDVDADDVVVESLTGGTDTMRSAQGIVLVANVENALLTGSAAVGASGNALANMLTGNDAANNLDGSTGNDTLVGNGGNDTLTGGAGNDSMRGGEGNDAYSVDSLLDLVNETGTVASTLDTVTSSVSWSLDKTGNLLVERLVLGGTAANGTGNALANTITGNASANGLNGGTGNDTLVGNAGNDTLIGAAGNDSMVGGDGNDSYGVDSLSDIVSELGTVASTLDTVTSSVSWSLNKTGNLLVERLVLGGTAANGTGNALANTIIGNASANGLNGGDGNDTLVGNAGNDTLIGAAGNDSMVGGDGNDSYGVDSLSDIVSELGTVASTLDTVTSSVSWSLNKTGNLLVERLVLGGTAASGTGNALANTITGNAAANVLDGLSGNDVLTGGLGSDTFVFTTSPNATSNADQITDFAAGSDHLQFENAVFTRLATTGALDAANFRANATGTAVDANDYLVYDTDGGQLYYDADGSGAGARVLIATLSGAPGLLAADIFVV